MGQLSQRGRMYGCAFLLTMGLLTPAPAYALGVEGWLRLPANERAIFLRGALDAWAFQEEIAKWSKPPASVPPQLAVVTACVKDLSMTDAQALRVVEVYMREYPGVLREFPMVATVYVALLRACRVVGPGEKGGK